MKQNVSIARPYAAAIFQIAKVSATQSEWLEILECLSCIVSNKKFAPLLSNPNLTHKIRVEILLQTLGEIISIRDELLLPLQNYLNLLGLFKRLAVIPSVLNMYQSYVSASEGILEVHVFSTINVEEEQKRALEASLATRLKSKLKVIYDRDEALLGGMVIKAGDWVLDYSIRGMLLNLNHSFKEVF